MLIRTYSKAENVLGFQLYVSSPDQLYVSDTLCFMAVRKAPHQREANKGKQHRDDYFYSEIVPTNRIKLFQSERTIYFTILPVAIILIC